jgi:hypothetical protein
MQDPQQNSSIGLCVLTQLLVSLSEVLNAHNAQGLEAVMLSLLA